MRHQANAILPRPELPDILQEPWTGPSCPFLQRLTLDIRYEIYKYVAFSETSETLPIPIVHVIDILDPMRNSRQPLTALLDTCKALRQELRHFAAQNTRWLMQSGGQIYVYPTARNTRFYLRWTEELESSYVPSKEAEKWQSFCFGRSVDPTAVRALEVDFDINPREAPTVLARLFSEARRLETALQQTQIGALPIARYLESFTVTLPKTDVMTGETFVGSLEWHQDMIGEWQDTWWLHALARQVEQNPRSWWTTARPKLLLKLKQVTPKIPDTPIPKGWWAQGRQLLDDLREMISPRKEPLIPWVVEGQRYTVAEGGTPMHGRVWMPYDYSEESLWN